ncbi:MAG: hypothetical protein B7Z26_04605 [Asticcacaulis sp. 32-58-5]|nr:MAG: hypothetical protein B7Z26_04605 [Asticcacaulis sp. 32-58-5]
MGGISMQYIRFCGLIIGLALLGACSKPAEGAYEDTYVSAMVAPSPKDAAQSVAGQELALPQLAYAYSYGIETPTDKFDEITRLHQAACDKAGPQNCLILSADSYGDKSIGELRKTLTLRVSPSWLKTFQAGLDSDLSKTRSQIKD